MPVTNPNVQKAISKLLKAGFQISPETLSMLQSEKNPHQMVDRFLALSAVHPTETPVLEPIHFQPPPKEKTEPIEEGNQISQELQIPKSTSSKRIAEDVKTDIQIIKDPTPELQSKGTIDDLSHNFQDRYYRLRDIIAQRVDGRGILDIQSLTEPNDSKGKDKTVKIVGMVSNKTLTKSGNIALEVEDPTGRITVIVQKREPTLLSKANMVLLDQVLVIEGNLANPELVFAKDLYLPDVPSNRRNNRA
ncbi:MAG: hypothetical protein ACXACH_04205, partial [Candidatus Hermodarchaeia archaeon]